MSVDARVGYLFFFSSVLCKEGDSGVSLILVGWPLSLGLRENRGVGDQRSYFPLSGSYWKGSELRVHTMVYIGKEVLSGWP